MTPDHVNPLQWQQALGYARQSCARIFRDGGSAEEALAAFGLAGSEAADRGWDKAVETIALHLCASEPLRRAA